MLKMKAQINSRRFLKYDLIAFHGILGIIEIREIGKDLFQFRVRHGIQQACIHTKTDPWVDKKSEVNHGANTDVPLQSPGDNTVKSTILNDIILCPSPVQFESCPNQPD